MKTMTIKVSAKTAILKAFKAAIARIGITEEEPWK
jgi:hypothetical protein